jgi:hypothetical protein
MAAVVLMCLGAARCAPADDTDPAEQNVREAAGLCDWLERFDDRVKVEGSTLSQACQQRRSEFIHALKKPGFYASLVDKCSTYYLLYARLYNKIAIAPGVSFACAKAASDFANVLDYDWDHKVAFRKELKEILERPDTVLYFQDLNDRLDRAEYGTPEPTLVWATTERFLKITQPGLNKYELQDKILQYLAVLFQDYQSTFQRPALDFIIENLAPALGLDTAAAPPAWFEGYLSVLEKISALEAEGIVTLAPPDFKGQETSSRWYHYYVPALAGKRLLARTGDATVAMAMPFLMNLVYELASGFDLARAEAGNLGLPLEPAPLDLSDTGKPEAQLALATLDDIYLGYLGALAGSEHTNQPLTRERLEEYFSCQAYKSLLGNPSLARVLAAMTFQESTETWRVPRCSSAPQ